MLFVIKEVNLSILSLIFFRSVLLNKGPVTQWLEYTPDKRGVSSSNLLEPIDYFTLGVIKGFFVFNLKWLTFNHRKVTFVLIIDLRKDYMKKNDYLIKAYLIQKNVFLQRRNSLTD